MALSFFLPRSSAPEYSAEQLFSLYRDSANPCYLEQLIALHGNDLYYFLLQQSDAALAGDISQQCWLTLVEQRGNFLGLSSFKTWLFSIGRNRLLDELRRLQRWQYQQSEEEPLAELLCPAQQLEQQQQQLQFNQQLLLLPFLQREALMLQLEGFSLAEISQITQQPAQTIKSRLRYAKQALQQLSGVNNDNT
ncbi:sigma-70 family RNA polymerase sigma factor [Rheinheimera sp.]|uniref:sigma-70 family RNA polymerase sigma factor n=1 Tax=Rheinheimera sp. TaxID=1869214 RepID=UPI0027370C72|nr:sigma-70 family RNA polymerase sigma factor [Rheinheimera sp.]MDP2715648.1 sigma-70 family RNA polymerase sigma factor [Rheinheimera sp.]